ncbi:MAG: formyltransferase family protein [Ghiorsea sp.]|nr:formyltransferase family protein [Ghiorsea sp.]
MKICFLASGGGGNLKFFHLSDELNILQNVELYVIADRECGSVEYARKHNIYTKIITYNRGYNNTLLDELAYINPDIIITNWYKIIDENIVSLYKGRLINLHYSLLPAFAGLIGLAPIEEAYKKKCKYIGVTCHYVDTGVDSGEVISQAVVKADIPIQLAIQKTFEKGCLILLNSVIRLSQDEIIEISINNQFSFSPSLRFEADLFK